MSPRSVYRRLRAGWADPGRAARAVDFLGPAGIIALICLAMLTGTHSGLAIVAAAVGLLAAAGGVFLALLILWGRDL